MDSRSASADGSTAWALFLNVHAQLVAKMERRLKAAGLPPLEWYDVLWALEQAPGHRLRMHVLADTLVLARFNLTRLIDRLEQRGLVARKRTQEDRRGAWAVLTNEGRGLRRKMWPVYWQAIVDLFNGQMSAQQLVSLETALRKLASKSPSGQG
jgi:DNA-binding MarR family transcriptional regulator